MIWSIRNSLPIIAIAVFTVSLLASNLFSPNAAALSGSAFKAGRITDDNVFFNQSTMSAADIQNFLNIKMPNCDTNGSQIYSGTTTRAQYGAAQGYPAPFTCLKDYSQDTQTRVAENQLCNQYNGGVKTSAQIIHDVAQACGVNPRVLLVLLQKEQALITDSWPWAIQYRSATGFGCPDTAPCDAEYYGFFNQVYNAARIFKKYARDAQNYNYRAYRNNNILFSPTSSCGSSPVYIENHGTASLYNYTPYQPNQAALNNLYGSGDGCSAYGNRNFWRMYNDWFGTTIGNPFEWQTIGTRIYDAQKNIEIATDNLHPGETYRVSAKVKNTGTEIWYRDGPNPLRLGTYLPKNNSSRSCDISWLSCSRPAKLVEEILYPGDEGHFEFTAAAVNELGEFRQYFQPVLENRAWMTNDTGFHVYSKTTNRYDWQWLSYDAWSDAARTIPVNTNDLSRNQTIYITLRIRNTGGSTWSKNGSHPVRIATAQPASPDSKTSPLCASDWLSCTSPAYIGEQTVLPGSVATFNFSIKANPNLGEYREYFKPVVEFKGWGVDNPNHMYLKVTR